MPTLRSTFAQRTLSLLAMGVALIVVIVGMSFWLVTRTTHAVDEYADERLFRLIATDIYTALLDSETGQRGFLLTREQAYLQPYEDAQRSLDDLIGKFRETGTSGDIATPAEIRDLVSVVAAKRRKLGQTVDLVRAGRHDEALALVESGSGRNAMDDIRGKLDTIIDRIEVRNEQRLAALSSATAQLTWMVAGGGGLIILLALIAVATVARYTRELVLSRAEVETLNDTLERRVEERTAELTIANEEIQRFAYIVTHDLRAPLVNIMGFTRELEMGVAALRKVIQKEVSDPKDVEAALMAADADLPEAVGFIRASTSKMDRLINVILKLSREGQRRLLIETIDLHALFLNLAASLRHVADDADARIAVQEGSPTVESDRVALEQVFGNLLDNAIKYLQPGRPGSIVIRAEQSADRVRIVITDNGRGIAEKDHERVFDLYRRAGVQDRPGEGIGLAHVRAVVRRLDGVIALRSRLGEGAEFTVDLPKKLILKTST